MRIKQVAVGLAAALALGCGHELALTATGTRVQNVDRAHLPDGCRVVGDVSIGIPPDAAIARSEAELAILMRNKAADMGASHVVIERSEPRPQPGGVVHHIGSGSAYVCTRVATGGGEEPPAAPPESTPAAEPPAATP